MKLFWVFVLMMVTLAGCGGSSGVGVTGVVTTPVVTVSAITASKLMYNLSSSITVEGTNLDQGISVAASGACSSMVELTGGTSTNRVYSCTPATVGSLNVNVSDKNNTILKSATFTVPNPQVTMLTAKGTIVVELDPAKAPITVKNFLGYVQEKFYDSTLFHRIVPGFVIQGGGYSTSGELKTTHSAIALEAPTVTGLTNSAGTIAMARGTDLNSATSQFFINTVDNNTSTGNNLDAPAGQGYAVFGKVVTGMDVVKLIESTPIVDPSQPSSFIAVTSMTQTK